jgi:penicillin-binding protein 1A
MTDPGTLKPYSVSGAGGTLTSVTSASSNGAFVRLNQVVGAENTIDLASRMGIPVTPDWVKKPSLPLGVADVTPLQMAAAYNAIPAGGVYRTPYFVERVEDRAGNVLFENDPQATRVVSAQTACLASEVLAKNVESGTGKNARLPNQVAAGKTGTTEGPTDVWFVGFTPYLTTAVWVGSPTEGGVELDEAGNKVKPTSLSKLPGREAWGSTYPAGIWQRFNELYHQGKAPLGFPGCEPPDRPARPLSGENDPFGALNGGFDPTGIGVISGPMKGKGGGNRAPAAPSAPRPPATAAPQPPVEVPADDAPAPPTPSPVAATPAAAPG